MLAEAEAGVNIDMGVSINHISESTIIESFLKELLENVIVEEVLSEVFNQLFTASDIIFGGVFSEDWFHEGLSHKFVFYGAAVHGLNEREDFDDFIIAAFFEQSLGEQKNKSDILAVIQDNLPSVFIFFKRGSILKVGINLIESLKIKLFKVDVIKTDDEILTSVLFVPLFADWVNIVRMDNYVPAFKDFDQSQFSNLLVSQVIVFVVFWVLIVHDVKDFFDLPLYLLIEFDRLISVNNFQRVFHQFLDKFIFVDF